MTSHSLLSIAVLQACQLTLLVGFVWLVTRTLTKNNAHLSYALWLVVLVKCFTPPIWSSPVGIFSWLHANKTAARTEELHIEANLGPQHRELESFKRPPTEGIPIAVLWSSDHPDHTDAAANVWTHAAGSVPSTPQPEREANRKPAIPSLWWAVVVWIGITILMVICTAWSAQRCIGRLLQSRVTDYELQRKTRELCDALGMKSGVRLVVTSCPVGPAVIGLFRPTIVVPEFIARQRTVDAMEPILAHELIHIRRGDLWIGMLRHLARSLWWFHPLVWKTSSAVRRGAEQCCDEEVIATLKISPSDYARALLSVLELKHELKTLPVVPGVRPIDITSTRMERIMKLRHGSHAKSPLWCWAIALLLALLSLPGAGVALEDGTQPPRGLTPVGHEIGPAAPVGQKTDTVNPDKPVVQLECWFVTGRDRDIRSIRVDWQVMAGSTVKPNDVEKNKGNPEQLAYKDGHGQSRVVIEKQLPIAYAMLDADRSQGLIKKLRGEKKFTVFCAPVLTVPDNSSGTIHTGNGRPFVIGVRSGQHEVRTVDCGFTCQLRPQIQLGDDGTEATDVSLSYELVTTSVLKVDDVIWRTDKGKGITVQIPETQTAVISGTNLVPTGKSLAIHGLLPMNTNDERESTLILVRPTVTLPAKVANVDQDAEPERGIPHGVDDNDGMSRGGESLHEVHSNADVNYRERWRLSLEECLEIALQNASVMKELVLVHEPLSESPDGNVEPPANGTGVYQTRRILARSNSRLSLTDVHIEIQNHFLEVMRTYWDLYYWYHNLQAARTGFASAHATWKTVASGNIRGKEGGESANESQARGQFFAVRSRLEQATNDLFVAEARLRFLLGVAATDRRLIQPTDEPTKARFQIDWEEAKQTAIARRPEIRRHEQHIKQQASRLLAALEQLLTQMDANTLYRFINSDDNMDSKLAETKTQEWRLGFEFQMPLGLRRKLADARNHQWRLRREEKLLQEITMEVTNQLAGAVRALEDQYQIAQTSFNALIAYRDQVEATRVAYEESQSVQLDLLLEAQRNLAQAEVDYFRDITQYNLAIAKVHYRKGTLIETLGYECAFAERAQPQKLDAAVDSL